MGLALLCKSELDLEEGLIVVGLAWGRAQNALAYSTANLPLATLRLRDRGVLSQHSRSSPTQNHANEKALSYDRTISLEGPVGLEPTTPCLKGRCSNQLSYGPGRLQDGRAGPSLRHSG